MTNLVRWLFSTNHKDIGTLYFIFGAIAVLKKRMENLSSFFYFIILLYPYIIFFFRISILLFIVFYRLILPLVLFFSKFLGKLLLNSNLSLLDPDIFFFLIPILVFVSRMLVRALKRRWNCFGFSTFTFFIVTTFSFSEVAHAAGNESGSGSDIEEWKQYLDLSEGSAENSPSSFSPGQVPAAPGAHDPEGQQPEMAIAETGRFLIPSPVISQEEIFLGIPQTERRGLGAPGASSTPPVVWPPGNLSPAQKLEFLKIEEFIHETLVRKFRNTRIKDRTSWVVQSSDAFPFYTQRFLRDPGQYLGAEGREGEDLLRISRSLKMDTLKSGKESKLYALLKQSLLKMINFDLCS